MSGTHGTSDVRRQLSLIVPAAVAGELAAVRRAIDPVQSRLIPPHVTLCREADLVGVSPDTIGARLAGAGPLTLTFGPAERFGGHGILLPCVGGRAKFDGLRARVLGGAAPQEQVPHLTLAHPRNPPAAADALAAAQALPAPLTVTFLAVQWIEQSGRAPWRVRRTFGLGGGP